jgi:hypothetical protein
LDRKTQLTQVLNAKPGSHEFPERHDADVNSHADFTNQTHASDKLLELVKGVIQQFRAFYSQGIGKVVMYSSDARKLVRLVAGRGRLKDLLQCIRYAF